MMGIIMEHLRRLTGKRDLVDMSEQRDRHAEALRARDDVMKEFRRLDPAKITVKSR